MELLIPAGNLERLKIAFLYGADAVYLGGQRFGLRAGADNFTLEEIKEGVGFAHRHGGKVYVVLNAFLHDSDLEGLEEFCQYLDQVGVDAVIVSDIGVIETVKKCSQLSIHLSTQASCLNIESGHFYKSLGVDRLIVGRELTIQQTGLISKQTGLEVEMFIHGAMCMAYSGNCVISNYTHGRDSNRGGCVQSCRHRYDLIDGDKKDSSRLFMSSKDLRGIDLVPQFSKNKIASLKIEGRMKSNLYVASMTKAYSQVLKSFQKGTLDQKVLEQAKKETEMVSHRDYTEASLVQKAGTSSIASRTHAPSKVGQDYLGTVLEVKKQSHVGLFIRNQLYLGDQIEFLTFNGENVSFAVSDMKNLTGEKIKEAKQNTFVLLPYHRQIENLNVVRLLSRSQQSDVGVMQ